MPRGMFEFLLPDMLASLSTLGAAYPAGQVAGMEKASQIDARNMEQQLRALQMLKDQKSLVNPTWKGAGGTLFEFDPSGKPTGQSLVAPARGVKQSVIEQARTEMTPEAFKQWLPAYFKHLAGTKAPIDPKTWEAWAIQLTQEGIPEAQWPPEVRETHRAKLKGTVEKSPTENIWIDQSIHGATPEIRQRAKENLVLAEQRKIRLAKEGTSARQEAIPTFATWTPAEKQFWFEQTAAGAPPPRFAFGDRKSYTEFNKGYAAWQAARGVSGPQAVAERADLTSTQRALSDVVRRSALVRTFTNRIELNVKIIKDLQQKYGKNEFGRMVNQAQNMALRGLHGSGDLESLRLALVSTSNEVAKVESGSLGIAEVSVSQAEQMKKIHDINLNANDLETVLNTSVRLGEASVRGIDAEAVRLKSRITTLGRSPSAQGTAPLAHEVVRPNDKAAPSAIRGSTPRTADEFKKKHGIQ